MYDEINNSVILLLFTANRITPVKTAAVRVIIDTALQILSEKSGSHFSDSMHCRICEPSNEAAGKRLKAPKAKLTNRAILDFSPPNTANNAAADRFVKGPAAAVIIRFLQLSKLRFAEIDAPIGESIILSGHTPNSRIAARCPDSWTAQLTNTIGIHPLLSNISKAQISAEKSMVILI